VEVVHVFVLLFALLNLVVQLLLAGTLALAFLRVAVARLHVRDHLPALGEVEPVLALEEVLAVLVLQVLLQLVL